MKYILLSLSVFLFMGMAQAQTLEECQQAADKHYPQIRQYGLIEKTTNFTVAIIAKGWLPQISLSAQAAYQSDAAAWPETMQGVMQQLGVPIQGLSKIQYRMGVDIYQLVYDGGALQAQQAVARSKGRVESAQMEVNLYALRQRVHEMYFSLLLLSEQIELNKDLQTLLSANAQRLEVMLKGGIAAESDWQSVKAELLTAVQQGIALQSHQRALQQLLSVFCGIEVKHPTKPAFPLLSQRPQLERPELRVFESQLQVLKAQEKALKSTFLPKFGFLAQGFYGYPGYNMFEDMMRHRWSLNAMVGAKLTWNLSAFYTRKNDKAKIEQQREMIENHRQTFLFNNHLQQVETEENMRKYQELMKNDAALLQLRTAVRKAGESKLAHGIIAISDLLRDINAETSARVQQTIHEIEWLKQVHQQYITLGLDKE